MPDASSGLARYVALAILAFEVGKLARDHQTREFFTASGYPATLMSAVMTAEIVGASGQLRARSRLAATGGLAMLMLRAIAHAPAQR